MTLFTGQSHFESVQQLLSRKHQLLIRPLAGALEPDASNMQDEDRLGM